MKLLSGLVLFFPLLAFSHESDLNKRVTKLEKLVADLNEQVEDLKSGEEFFTCKMNSFGKTFAYSAKSQDRAKTKVLKSCAEATDAIHCRSIDVRCTR